MRECGECTLCCKMAKINTYKSPEGKYCKHCEINKGCKIYVDRPYECSSFECAWLKGNIPEKFYPKNCGFLVEQITDNVCVIIVDPIYKKKWDTPELEELTDIMKTKGISSVINSGYIKLANNMTVSDAQKSVLDFMRNRNYG